MIVLPPHPVYKTNFGIAKTSSGWYVCPGWYPVPEGTTRDQITFNESVIINKEVEAFVANEQTEWKVPGSKPGVVYQVNRYPDGDWTCSCPAKAFKRGDCKHIISLKNK